MFTRAIVRPPAANFSDGLTSAGLGAPDYENALRQHEAYCAVLAQSGLTVTKLAPDPAHPDSSFVEDTAIVTNRCAVITRPGAPSRRGEVDSMRLALADFFPELISIELPGTVDGGDVCEAGDHFYIGLSERTNDMGAQQLSDLLTLSGYTCSFVDIRNTEGLLHLKSGLAHLAERRLVVTEALAGRAEFNGYDLIIVESHESYAANCIRVNDHVLVAAGYPAFTGKLRELGYQVIELEMTEFQKMDGGLSCLSLRF
ncbi:MAG: dimethylarginine dimethylaminohydrolase family protein [Pyrinomonadaceae bacterium]